MLARRGFFGFLGAALAAFPFVVDRKTIGWFKSGEGKSDPRGKTTPLWRKK